MPPFKVSQRFLSNAGLFSRRALIKVPLKAQLAETLPGAPWDDGTVGGVLGANADHGHMHWKWVTDAGLVEVSTDSQ